MKWQGWSLYDNILAVLNKTMLFILYRVEEGNNNCLIRCTFYNQKKASSGPVRNLLHIYCKHCIYSYTTIKKCKKYNMFG